MYLKNHKGIRKLVIYERGKKKKVDNQQLNILGVPGSGKSVLVQRIVFLLWKLCNYIVIYITEKEGGEFDAGYAMFKPTETYHLKALKIYGEEPEAIPVKLYHPFTFNIPKDEKHPLINFYTFSAKRLSSQTVSAILTGEADAEKVRICYEEIQSLKDDENLYDLVLKISSKISVEDVNKIKISEDNMFIPMKASGDKSTISRISDSFKPFTKEDFYIRPDNFNLEVDGYKIKNIDFNEILDDQEHYHIFIKKWIKDKRRRYATDIQLLSQLKEAIASKKTRKKVLIVLEELKSLFPRKDPDRCEIIMARQLKDLFAQLRSQDVYTISTMQSETDVSDVITNSFTQHLLSRLSNKDIKSKLKDFGYSSEAKKRLFSVNAKKKGQFIWEEDLEANSKLV